MAIQHNPPARFLEGRTIVHVEYHPVRVRDGRRATKTMTDPTFTLGDGSKIWFTTQENPDGGDYGVTVTRLKE